MREIALSQEIGSWAAATTAGIADHDIIAGVSNLCAPRRVYVSRERLCIVADRARMDLDASLLEITDALRMSGRCIRHLPAAELSTTKMVPDRVRQHYSDVGVPPLPIVAVRHIVWGVARALAALHDRGWIHQDVKPGNVLLYCAPGCNSGIESSVRLCDYGMATREVAEVDADVVDSSASTLAARLEGYLVASTPPELPVRSGYHGVGESDDYDAYAADGDGPVRETSRWEGRLYHHVVTLSYRAPELLFGASSHGAEIDSWGLGIMLVELTRLWAMAAECCPAGCSPSTHLSDSPALGESIIPNVATRGDVQTFAVEGMPAVRNTRGGSGTKAHADDEWRASAEYRAFPCTRELEILSAMSQLLGQPDAVVWPTASRHMGWMRFTPSCGFCRNTNDAPPLPNGAPPLPGGPNDAPPLPNATALLHDSCASPVRPALWHAHAVHSLLEWSGVNSLKSEELVKEGKLALDLALRLLALDPARRITAREALQHPFLRPHSCADVLESGARAVTELAEFVSLRRETRKRDAVRRHPDDGHARQYPAASGSRRAQSVDTWIPAPLATGSHVGLFSCSTSDKSP